MTPITIDDVVRACRFPLKNDQEKLVRDAYVFAEKAHAGQLRRSGKPYITHTLQVAKILAEIGMDPTTLAAGILHDVPEDTPVPLSEIESRFGEEVAYLVDGVTKLGKIRLRGSHEEYFLENLRKMFLAMARDIRVVIIKLADRLHNMRTLEFVPVAKQERIARETMEIYGPIANRLGIGEIKGELEDLCFQYLDPEHYAITKEIAETYLHQGKTYMDDAVIHFRRLLEKEKIKVVDISGRMKYLYRLFKKLERHDMDVTRIYDLIAIRIIVPEIADCYEALGIIHREYRPMVGRIKDYISLPKPNGYQSLHTTVFGPQGRILEIQIRTEKMHTEAEFGIAAHWIYTERDRRSWKNLFTRKKEIIDKEPRGLEWVRQLQEWQKEIGRDDEEFLRGLKIDFFKNHIFAFTPKGDIIELPEDATPIDFAYAIHSEIGDRATGAKADSKIIPLDQPIINGQVIEILTEKNKKKPSRDWLDFVKTSTAKAHIRRALRDDGLFAK
ncbi:MAG: bifunctional (p)ppGpp synthetase/guanosine-3',5'-bis(diphosphate) 3'-pyrophosphohydrolase [Candidatus Moraniibacteriota bacterium]|nr:MAG: bifunctional (p)ppGpp synthetase/guanosine-3',5'-bis(diphosphate) 3'-pyrophosphohydrolase [Candidatus Moranbacteria bacterium]